MASESASCVNDVIGLPRNLVLHVHGHHGTLPERNVNGHGTQVNEVLQIAVADVGFRAAVSRLSYTSAAVKGNVAKVHRRASAKERFRHFRCAGECVGEAVKVVRFLPLLASVVFIQALCHLGHDFFCWQHRHFLHQRGESF